MPIPVGLAAAARLLASKGARDAIKKHGKTVIDKVKAYNAANAAAPKAPKAPKDPGKIVARRIGIGNRLKNRQIMKDSKNIKPRVPKSPNPRAKRP